MVVEGNMDRAIAMEGERQKSDDDEVLFSHQKNPEEKNRWLTKTESSASHETEEEKVKPVRAPPGLSDPIDDREETRLEA